jgi:hypothetical protein
VRSALERTEWVIIDIVTCAAQHVTYKLVSRRSRFQRDNILFFCHVGGFAAIRDLRVEPFHLIVDFIGVVVTSWWVSDPPYKLERTEWVIVDIVTCVVRRVTYKLVSRRSRFQRDNILFFVT